jgi:hypothetical protein
VQYKRIDDKFKIIKNKPLQKEKSHSQKSVDYGIFGRSDRTLNLAEQARHQAAGRKQKRENYRRLEAISRLSISIVYGGRKDYLAKVFVTKGIFSPLISRGPKSHTTLFEPPPQALYKTPKPAGRKRVP